MRVRKDKFDLVAQKFSLPLDVRSAAPASRPAAPAPSPESPRGAAIVVVGKALASLEELTSLLHQRSLRSGGLLRVASPASVDQGLAFTGADGRADATVQHPLYGAYLAEWLETHQPEPGRHLLGLVKSSLGDLRSCISRSGGKFKPASPSDQESPRGARRRA